ncbi:unnamed protein product [Caretta caretta]
MASFPLVQITSATSGCQYALRHSLAMGLGKIRIRGAVLFTSGFPSGPLRWHKDGNYKINVLSNKWKMKGASVFGSKNNRRCKNKTAHKSD